MNINEEISRMEDVIDDLIIDKLMNIDPKTDNIEVSNDKDILSTEIILKNEVVGSEEITSTVKFTIEKKLIKANIVEKRKDTSFAYGSANTYTKLQREYQVSTVWNIFLSKKQKKIKEKVKELFNFTLREKEYKKLKYVIENQLDNKLLRKIKLKGLKEKEES